jgi:hypothetical protein
MKGILMATAKTTTEKKPAAKKVTANKPKAAAAAKPKAVKKVATKSASAPKTSSAERYKMIEVAAYFIAERDNFSGCAVEYWIAAEKQMSKILK